MIRQYYPQRFRRCEKTGRPVGGVGVGTILYLQSPRDVQCHGGAVCRHPYILEAWLPRESFGGKFCRGGHLAQLRSLRDGIRVRAADWMIRYCDDEGLVKH